MLSPVWFFTLRVARRRLVLKIYPLRRRFLQARLSPAERNIGSGIWQPDRDLTDKYNDAIATILASERAHATERAALAAQHVADIETINKKHAAEVQAFHDKVLFYNEEIRVANHRRFAAEEALFRANLPRVRISA